MSTPEDSSKPSAEPATGAQQHDYLVLSDKSDNHDDDDDATFSNGVYTSVSNLTEHNHISNLSEGPSQGRLETTGVDVSTPRNTNTHTTLPPPSAEPVGAQQHYDDIDGEAIVHNLSDGQSQGQRNGAAQTTSSIGVDPLTKSTKAKRPSTLNAGGEFSPKADDDEDDQKHSSTDRNDDPPPHQPTQQQTNADEPRANPSSNNNNNNTIMNENDADQRQSHQQQNPDSHQDLHPIIKSLKKVLEGLQKLNTATKPNFGELTRPLRSLLLQQQQHAVPITSSDVEKQLQDGLCQLVHWINKQCRLDDCFPLLHTVEHLLPLISKLPSSCSDRLQEPLIGLLNSASRNAFLVTSSGTFWFNMTLVIEDIVCQCLLKEHAPKTSGNLSSNNSRSQLSIAFAKTLLSWLNDFRAMTKEQLSSLLGRRSLVFLLENYQQSAVLRVHLQNSWWKDARAKWSALLKPSMFPCRNTETSRNPSSTINNFFTLVEAADYFPNSCTRASGDVQHDSVQSSTSMPSSVGGNSSLPPRSPVSAGSANNNNTAAPNQLRETHGKTVVDQNDASIRIVNPNGQLVTRVVSGNNNSFSTLSSAPSSTATTTNIIEELVALFREYDITNINNARNDFARLANANLDRESLLLMFIREGESGFNAELTQKVGISMGTREKLRHVFARERKKKRFFPFRWM